MNAGENTLKSHECNKSRFLNVRHQVQGEHGMASGSCILMNINWAQAAISNVLSNQGPEEPEDWVLMLPMPWSYYTMFTLGRVMSCWWIGHFIMVKCLPPPPPAIHILWKLPWLTLLQHCLGRYDEKESRGGVWVARIFCFMIWALVTWVTDTLINKHFSACVFMLQ